MSLAALVLLETLEVVLLGLDRRITVKPMLVADDPGKDEGLFVAGGTFSVDYKSVYS